MASSTRTLQDTVNLAQIFVRNAPLTGINGVTDEPALSIANTVASLMLSPPLDWPWNSSVASGAMTVGTQDTSIPIANFGWLTGASIAYGGKTYQLELRDDLSLETNQQRPAYVCTKSTDGAGNWTFRVLPAPDQAYTLTVQYQQAAPTFTALTQTWSPIPDSLQALYELGFRAFVYEYLTDPRFQLELAQFLSRLVAAHGGLTDQEKDLVLWDRVRDVREQVNAQAGGRR